MSDNTQTQTTPGVPPPVTNRDGSTINSGGKVGKLATSDQTGKPQVAPDSFTAPPLPKEPAGRKD